MTDTGPAKRPVTATPHVPSAAGAGGLCLILLVVAMASAWRQRERPAAAPQLSDVSFPLVSQERCAECHAEIVESFRTAPHAQTLHRGNDPEARLHFAGRQFVDEQSKTEFHYADRGGRLWLSTPSYGRDVAIDWIFGSGTHAQTPLMTWTGQHGGTVPVEHRVSWYPGNELGRTLGSEDLPDRDAGISCLGRAYTPAEAATCFGCHSTRVPVTEELKIRFDDLVPNIGCVRCHWQSDEHARSMESGKPAAIESLSELPAREAVDRCGECHRRASEQTSHLIVPDEKTMVRFAPVGLVQSPCFVRQQEVELEPGRAARLDCTTCHDPHSSPKREWQTYVTACLECHDQGRQRARDCPVSKRSDNCLPCHMPKVAMNHWLSFTDHWIRAKPKWSGVSK